jgi:hypothetical protein
MKIFNLSNDEKYLAPSKTSLILEKDEYQLIMHLPCSTQESIEIEYGNIDLVGYGAASISISASNLLKEKQYRATYALEANSDHENAKFVYDKETRTMEIHMPYLEGVEVKKDFHSDADIVTLLYETTIEPDSNDKYKISSIKDSTSWEEVGHASFNIVEASELDNASKTTSNKDSSITVEQTEEDIEYKYKHTARMKLQNDQELEFVFFNNYQNIEFNFNSISPSNIQIECKIKKNQLKKNENIYDYRK